MTPEEIEQIEIDLLTMAIYRRYGFDFRDYSTASLRRRVRNYLAKIGFSRPTEIIPKMLSDSRFLGDLVFNISVPVTEMFRDPAVYGAIRRKVVPVLATYPFVKIWHAGCATGEEVYSMAILLTEAGLYDRCQIYATDMNEDALAAAGKGIYDIGRVKSYGANYLKAGGTETLSAYYHSQYDSVIMNQGLKKNIVFANHNLASDASFGEMHLIICRNVMIYFNQRLQDRVLKLIKDSLVRGGYLCLGTKENIRFSQYSQAFADIDREMKIYQKPEPSLGD